MAGAASLKVPAPRPPKVKASTPAARAIKLDPKLSGTVTPDHFCTDSAIIPTPGAAVDKALAPAPPNVNPCIPDDRIPSCVPKPSGTVTPAHFFIESANAPSGAATVDNADAPNPENVLSNAPRPTVSKAAPIAVRPLPISSHDISPNFCKPLAKSSSPCTANVIVPAPTSPAKPDRTPIAALIPPTSISAVPIATRPRSISLHCIEPNFCSPFARSSKP